MSKLQRITETIKWFGANWKKTLSLVVAGIIISMLLRDCACKRIVDSDRSTLPIPTPEHVTDTVSIKKPYKLPVVAAKNIPVKRKLYVKKDTVLRDSLEKKPIITHVEIKPGEVDVDIIDTAGNVKTEVHKINTEETKAVEIGPSGEVDEKKRTKAGIWIRKAGKKIVKGLAVAGAVAIVVVIIIAASK
jgi:hypothetical protein